MILEIKNYKDERIGAIALTENNINGEIEIYNKDKNTLVLDRSYQYDDIFGTNDRKISIHIEPKENKTNNNMINIEKIGEEIAQKCYERFGDDILFEHINEEINYQIYNNIKENILERALEYLEENNINYIM